MTTYFYRIIYAGAIDSKLQDIAIAKQKRQPRENILAVNIFSKKILALGGMLGSIIALAVGCQLKPEVMSFKYPLLKECVQPLTARFDRAMNETDSFSYSLEYFDKPMLHFSTFVGYFELSSVELTGKQLERIANDVILGCYPTESESYSVESDDLGSGLANAIYFEQKRGTRKLYSTIDFDGTVKIIKAQRELLKK